VLTRPDALHEGLSGEEKEGGRQGSHVKTRMGGREEERV
jgi:hypothetical protein